MFENKHSIRDSRIAQNDNFTGSKQKQIMQPLDVKHPRENGPNGRGGGIFPYLWTRVTLISQPLQHHFETFNS